MGSWNEEPALTPQHNSLYPQEDLGRSWPLCFWDAQSFGIKPNSHHMAFPVAAGDLQQNTVATSKCFSRYFHGVTYQMYVVANCELWIFPLFTLYEFSKRWKHYFLQRTVRYHCMMWHRQVFRLTTQNMGVDHHCHLSRPSSVPTGSLSAP